MANPFTLLTGASAGIGKEMAIICAKRGFNLLLVSLPGSNLSSFANELRENFKVEVDYFEIDLSETHAPVDVYNWCVDNGYQVNILINNVGTGGRGKFETLELSDIQSMIQINTCVISSLTNLFIPMLRQQKKAFILNVSSTASYFNIPNKALYAATKAFVNTLTSSLRNELAKTNISVSLLCPGGSTHRVDAHVGKKLNKYFVNIIHETPQSIAKAGIDGMLKKKRLILPGTASKLYVLVSKLIPVVIADKLVNRLFRPSMEKVGKNKKRLVVAESVDILHLLIPVLFFS